MYLYVLMRGSEGGMCLPKYFSFFPQLKERLCLESIAADHIHFIQGTSAVTDTDSLRVALDTLVEALLAEKELAKATQ